MEAELREIVARQTAAAERLEAAIPDLTTTARTAALLAKRVCDRLEVDVAQSDAERAAWLADLGIKDKALFEKLAGALKVRELLLVDVFSERILDVVEGAKTKVADYKAQATVMREHARSLSLVLSGASAAEGAPTISAGDEARETLVPSPEGGILDPRVEETGIPVLPAQ